MVFVGALSFRVNFENGILGTAMIESGCGPFDFDV